jgi:1-acyl-sn-glycerol-3-phosphate acyltransferase
MDTLISICIWLTGFILTIVLFPLSVMLWFITYPFDQERVVFHWWMVFHGIIVTRLIPFRKITIEGRNKASRGTAYVIISNHQSILDIIILNCLRYRFKWISKIENNKVPVIGWYLKMARYITVDRGNKESKAEMLDQAAEGLRKGISIMIFPEGTRSADNEIAPFKLGAFQLALMTDKSILPVVVDGTGNVLPKHGMVFSRRQTLKIKVLDPVHPGSFGTADPEKLAARFRDLLAAELSNMRNATQ